MAATTAEPTAEGLGMDRRDQGAIDSALGLFTGRGNEGFAFLQFRTRVERLVREFARAGADVIHHLASPFPMAAPKNSDNLIRAARDGAPNDASTIGERYIVSDKFYWLKDFAQVLREAFPDRASKIPQITMPDFIVRLGALFSGDMKTIAVELGKRLFSSSEKVRKVLGRDLIAGDEAIRASAETLIRYNAI